MNMSWTYILILIVIFLISMTLTWLVRKYSLSNELIDVPNFRSSHTISTPRGGGLSISIISLFCFMYLFFTEYISLKECMAMLLPLFLVFISGWVDDHNHIPSQIRAMIYFVASAWLVLFFPVNLSIIETDLFPGSNLVFKLLLIIFIVWIINLYNFMDGIDGLAALEAMSTAAFAGFVFYQAHESGLFIFSLVLFASTAGFLFWNWSPARIFMGDVGSCTLGLTFCVMAILAYEKAGISFLIWLVLLSVFIADSTFTLIKRIVRREKWYVAHKQHAYQLLVQAGFSHRFVSLSVTAINVIFLWPLAYFLSHNNQYALLTVFFNYLFLGVLWLYIHHLTGRGTKQI